MAKIIERHFRFGPDYAPFDLADQRRTEQQEALAAARAKLQRQIDRERGLVVAEPSAPPARKEPAPAPRKPMTAVRLQELLRRYSGDE